jgi:L-fucose mutarotase/ribose pyranase (RbsD/FucU family)
VTFADEDDHVFYDTARKAHAIRVTGNKKHYPDEKWIVSPADFIADLE